MISQEDLREIGKIKTPVSKPRKLYVDKIKPWLDSKEIVIIKGIRRCGKTHIMYQLFNEIKKESVFYFNFEDFRFEGMRNIELLEKIIQLREFKKKSYFFFDEIQQISGFERWLRTYYDKELPIKFIIGGSNISLLTPELATVLTGRNITFTIKPLSWLEIKNFKKISFEDYLTYGGFPEIILENDKEKKIIRLQQYVSDIIAKDILFRKKTENTTVLRELINFLLKNPGVKISANKLGSQLGISKDTAQKYIEIIKDTFIIFEVPYFSYSAKSKYIGNQASKYYVCDNGFITAVSIKKNLSCLFENIVSVHLNQSNELYYWQERVEIDFIYKNKAIQVTATNDIPKREIEAFKEFSLKHKHFEQTIITPNKTVLSVSLKEFLLKL